jgi:pimeloyl-ACP methyl ester carboxylesterase
MKKTIFVALAFMVLAVPISISAQQKKEVNTINFGNNPAAGKYLSTRGIKLYYETYGKGEPLLLIHGNGGSIHDMKYQIAYFQKYYKVIIADSRSQGKSIDTAATLNYETMADDFNALLDSLHIKSANVIGWSYGGINGLLLAIRHPEKVKKLVASGANLIPDASVLNPSGVEFIEDTKKQLNAGKQDATTKNNLKLLNMMALEPHIPLTDLHKISCPVLVVGGDNDVIKPAHTLQIFENIPQAYLWILPASGHATLQRYKDEFNPKVKDFFTQPFRKIQWDDWDK